MTEGEETNPVIAYADLILARYDDEEFDIDGSKASEIEIAEPAALAVAYKKDVKNGYTETNLAFAFANAIGNYRRHRAYMENSGPNADSPYAIRLTRNYDLLRSHGCIIDGRATKRRIGERDATIKDSQQRVEELTKKLGVLEHRLKECGDEKIEMEKTIASQKERIDATRAEDISRSLGSTTSTTEREEEK